MQNVEPDQPQHSHGERILGLGNGPLQRAAGGAQVISEVYDLMLLGLVRHKDYPRTTADYGSQFASLQR